MTETQQHQTAPNPAHNQTIGLGYGVAAYGWWALLFPLHLKLLGHHAAPETTANGAAWAGEILGHRVAWSLLLCVALVLVLRRGADLRQLLKRKRSVALLAGTAALVSINWLIFIYAVATDQISRAAIGYFINPIVNVALGMIFLHERLRPGQWASVALACLGIAALVLISGALPWIELTLALSFGFYGLLRKQARAGPVVGLTVETAILTPFALAYLVFAALTQPSPPAFVNSGPVATTLLILTGVSTALPLLWFAAAAKRLPLVTVGFLQFLAPTGHFLLGVLAFGERPSNPWSWLGYALIWSAVAAFIIDATRARKDARDKDSGAQTPDPLASTID